MDALEITTVPLRDIAQGERLRSAGYPISRWYLRPLAGRVAAALAGTPVRPIHLTLAGLMLALASATVLVLDVPQGHLLAAAGVLAAWFCDRTDGQLARRQRTESSFGAWLDGNVDELSDVGLHAAVAVAAVRQCHGNLPIWLLVAFLAGKYLMFYGIREEEDLRRRAVPAGEPESSPRPPSTLRQWYHVPGNADVRIHFLAIALVFGWFTAELALVAAYYNLRWAVRYALVARRWRPQA